MDVLHIWRFIMAKKGAEPGARANAHDCHASCGAGGAPAVGVAHLYRWAKEMFSFLTRPFRKPSVHHPEHAYRVHDTGDALLCVRDGAEEKTMRWDAITDVSIVTTDGGPFFPDVFWRFRDGSAEIVFPQMALGEKEVLDRVMKMQEFDFERFNAAMTSTQNAEFAVWEKNEEIAQPGARANDHSCHGLCLRTPRASCSRGSPLTFGNINSLRHGSFYGAASTKV